MMLYYALFFIRCLKNPDTSNAFLSSLRPFSKGITRSSTHQKLTHSLSQSNASAHNYFNRLPRLWNSLLSINLDLSINTIKSHFHQVLWTKFNSSFPSSNACSFYRVCGNRYTTFVVTSCAFKIQADPLDVSLC